MVRMKVTIEGYYNANPDYYPKDATPQEMANIDMNNGTGTALDVIQTNLKFNIKPCICEQIK